MKSARTTLIAFSMLLLPGQALMASGLGGEDEDQHGSHVHGTANLQLVLDNATLEIKLSSPAVNLLGYEGAANTAEKEATADAARETLEQPGKLFRLQGVDCRLADNGIELTGLPEHDDHGDEHDDDHHDDDHHGDDHHDDDDHEDGHHDDDHHEDGDHDDDHHEDGHHDDDHHEDGDHDDGHEDSHHDGDHHDDDHHHEGGHHDEVHSDIVATYRFECDGSIAESLQLPLLTAFPGIEKLDTQWIVAGKQGARTLGQGDQTLNLR